MTRLPPRKARPDFESHAWFAVLYVLTPGLVLGSLAEHAKGGLTTSGVLFSVLLGLGGVFIAAMQLVAADKVGARLLFPVIAVASALVGKIYLAYGVSVFLGASGGA